jgi:hypothetical protein
MLIATTRARDFIHYCKSLRADPELNAKPNWLKVSARTFRDVDAKVSLNPQTSVHHFKDSTRRRQEELRLRLG